MPTSIRVLFIISLIIQFICIFDLFIEVNHSAKKYNLLMENLTNKITVADSTKISKNDLELINLHNTNINLYRNGITSKKSLIISYKNYLKFVLNKNDTLIDNLEMVESRIIVGQILLPIMLILITIFIFILCLGEFGRRL